MDVSVIIATRNRPEMLRLAIASILAHRAEAIVEVIVVYDQASPDYSLKEEFAGHNVQVLTNTRTPGLAGARNTGTLASKATWVGFCDDDDEWLPEKLQKQLVLAADNPDYDFFVSGITTVAEKTEVARPLNGPVLTHRDFLRSRVAEAHPSTFLFRREEFLRQVGLMDEGLLMATDHDLLLRYTRHRNVLAVTDPVVRVRMHTKSFYSTNWENRLAELGQMLERHPELEAEPLGMARFRSRRAFALASDGRRREAIKESLAALRLNWREARALLAVAVSLSLVRPETLIRVATRYGRGL